MNLAQHAWRSVTGNAKRTGLGTAPLILLVVITLVGVIGAHEGVRSFARQIDDRGGAQILVGAEPRSGLVSEAARLEILQDLADDLRTNLAEVPTTVITQRRSPAISLGSADDEIDSFELQASLVTVDPHFAAALALKPAVGRFFSATDFDSEYNVAVLGSELAASYGIRNLDQGPIQVQLDEKTLLVVGVMFPASRLPVLDSSLIVPRTAAVFESLDSPSSASPSDTTQSASSTLLVGSSITRLANDARVTSVLTRLFSQNEANVSASYQRNALRDFDSGTSSLVATINLLLLVAAVGSALASLQLQSSATRLRHREIGTRLAMGYSPASIRQMLLLEGLFSTAGVILATAPIAITSAMVTTAPTGVIAAAYAAAIAVIAALSISLPQVVVHRALRMHPYHLLVKA